MSHTPAMDAFKAFRIHSEGGKIAARFEKLTLDDLKTRGLLTISPSGAMST